MDVATQQLESNDPPLKAQPQPWLRCKMYITIEARVWDSIEVIITNQKSTEEKNIE